MKIFYLSKNLYYRYLFKTTRKLSASRIRSQQTIRFVLIRFLLIYLILLILICCKSWKLFFYIILLIYIFSINNIFKLNDTNYLYFIYALLAIVFNVFSTANIKKQKFIIIIIVFKYFLLKLKICSLVKNKKLFNVTPEN